MTTVQTKNHTITVSGITDAIRASINSDGIIDGIEEVHIRLEFLTSERPSEITLSWNHPIVDAHSRWHPTADWRRGNQVDWGGNGVMSRVTSGAPVVCLHSLSGHNRLTIAFSDGLHSVRFKAGVHEETASYACAIQLFCEPGAPIAVYEATLRLDTRDIPYYDALGDVQRWWESLPGYTPSPVPETARRPMYSSWYSFHQQLETDAVELQCRIAKAMGCDAIIVDDGWQTNDNNRGYAYCGDWQPLRIPKMREHVQRVHQLGMKYLLWYSVPFVGVHSESWERFQGKYLNPKKADVRTLDPRYPDVREYLITTYEKAMREWDLDGFKLDFVDSIQYSQATEEELAPGRDYESVPEAADRLLSDVIARLRAINPEVMIEFRQSYIGPLMRKYGNMFRAGDCPNDSLTNRLRTIDIRLLCGNTAAHADMLMWHHDDPVESAALQLLNILFSVPQISVRLDTIPSEHLEMLKFWLAFWREHRDVLLDGKLMPLHPESLYPVVLAATDQKWLAGVYADHLIPLDGCTQQELLIVNGKHSEKVVLDVAEDFGRWKAEIRDCRGQVVRNEQIELSRGLHMLVIPPSGLARLDR